MSENQEIELLDEFQNLVGTDLPKTGQDEASRGSSGLLENLKPEDEEMKIGQLTQYALFGTGFMPTSSTVKILPAGAYRIKPSQQGFWFSPQRVVTDKLIQFPDSRSDSVIAEIEEFWGLKKKFAQYGFSHKRGFLLWGPPGSGKSCTIAITIAKMVKKNGLVIIADHPEWLAEGLAKIRSVEPDREMVVIWEDLDAVIDRFGESEVLAVLDGEAQIDNVVFVATTNYPEKLDGRVTNRPSRFDRIEKIDMPSDAARAVFFQTKLGTLFAPDGTDLIEETRGLSIAHLREVIVGIWCQGSKPKDVLARLNRMKIKPSSGNAGLPIGLSAAE